MLTKEEGLLYLKNSVTPALGCTEPACIALCTAAAAKEAEGELKKIDITINPGLYKNGMSVAIPGFSEIGIAYAVALGALIAKTDNKLQIFKDLTPDIARKAKELVAKKIINVTIDREQKKIYAHCKLLTSKGLAESEILGSHTNVTKTTWNGDVRFCQDIKEEAKDNALVDKLTQMSIAEIVSLARSLDTKDLQFILDGAKQNDTVADYGIENPSPVGIVASYNSEPHNSLMSKIMQRVAASVEARLDGCQRSVMSSAGSGSKGLAVSVPLSLAAREKGLSDKELATALAFAHFINGYINTLIGKLSPMCTCAIGASTATAAALTLLWGGSDEQIGFAIRNMTGCVTGMLCDGGKAGCAMKQAMATSAAYISAKMAINHSVLRKTDGICAAKPEDCIKNIATIAKKGMPNADNVMLDIMLAKN